MKTLILCCLLGFSSASFAGWFDNNENVLWQFRDQYVRIEAQESGSVPNQHPVKFAPDQIRHLLASLTVQRDTKLYPVFTETELKLISEPITKALSMARAEDDVSFAIVGMHPGLLTNENRVITGRIFFQQQQLQIVFGLLHEEINEKQDRRLYPFTLGSRSGSLESTKWKLQTSAGQVLVAERPDWIALTPKTVLAQAVSTQLLKPEQVARETAQVRQETTRLNSEQKQLLENTSRLQQEVSQLKQEVTTLKQAPAVPVAKKAVAPAPAVNAASSSVEQRLLTLQQLRDKQLITEQEYQQRRLKILDSL